MHPRLLVLICCVTRHTISLHLEQREQRYEQSVVWSSSREEEDARNSTGRPAAPNATLAALDHAPHRRGGRHSPHGRATGKHSAGGAGTAERGSPTHERSGSKGGAKRSSANAVLSSGGASPAAATQEVTKAVDSAPGQPGGRRRRSATTTAKDSSGNKYSGAKPRSAKAGHAATTQAGHNSANSFSGSELPELRSATAGHSSRGAKRPSAKADSLAAAKPELAKSGNSAPGAKPELAKAVHSSEGNSSAAKPVSTNSSDSSPGGGPAAAAPQRKEHPRGPNKEQARAQREQEATEKLEQYHRSVAKWRLCKKAQMANPKLRCKGRPEREAPERPMHRGLPLVTTAEFFEYTFDSYALDFNKEYSKYSEEWNDRELNFNENLRKVIHMRRHSEIWAWNPGITLLMDYGEDQYRTLLGYTGLGGRNKSSINGYVSDRRVAEEGDRPERSEVPDIFAVLNESTKRLTSFVRNQGRCGSCWAAAAIATLEGALEVSPSVHEALAARALALGAAQETLSTEAMVACTENPGHCGGTGGCRGATAELAYEMVKERGLPLAAEWLYTAGEKGKVSSCDAHRFDTDLLISISDYQVLPVNNYKRLLHTLYSRGHPIAVAVDATNWRYYVGGIYRDTDIGLGDFTVNHAVTLVGYRKPNVYESGLGGEAGASALLEVRQEQLGYWLIKNSWGPYFGEHGFIRIEMKTNESEHCGWDNYTHIGVACDGDPDRAWVCGTCGILYDATYPLGVKVKRRR